MKDFLKTFDLTQTDAIMILVWLVLFVVIWKLLSRSFFLPYLKLIEAREQATSGANDRAQEKNRKADELQKEYEKRIFEEKVKVLNQRTQALSAARAAAQTTIEAAEKEAQNFTMKFRDELKSKMSAVERNIPTEAQSLAELLIGKVKKGESARA